ncbi:DUF1178 family protein [Litorisediminicola beolgyonensis]|uniref:DUF1178 family protein n=1 Tax=Litorisediminicola beolgyonensis TaxID=1173614 RepID=A0ABW3ZKW5_9RHOB
MISYSLRCAEGHSFDSWFASSDAYDSLAAAGHVTCAVCGSDKVEKELMTPRVGKSDTAATKTPLSAPKSPAEQAIAKLRAEVEKTSDYVGTNFAREARAIHEGSAEERPIWGEARREDAKKLIEDGIPVAPLPFRPTRKSN